MAYRIQTLFFLGILSIFFSCKKTNDNSISHGESYKLTKTCTEHYENGKIVDRECISNPFESVVIFKDNNSFSLSYNDEETGEKLLIEGRIDFDNNMLIAGDQNILFYFENQELVLLTEDYIEKGSGNKSLAYYHRF